MNDSASASGLTTGAVVGDFEVLSQLGSGGMGVAYKAFDRRLKRTVALKTLHQAIADLPDMRRRLLREARAVAGLAHPNICTIYTIVDVGGVPFMVMEYVKGRSLASVIADGAMDPLEVGALATQVADALDVAHRHGIVHRDIKPANVMVSDDGQVKVLDFGLAAPLMPAAAELLRNTMASVNSAAMAGAGTLGYMSPEQLEGGEVDARTDLFSLGVVLYELSTGRNPFLAQTTVATIARVLSSEVPPVRAQVPDFPAHLDAIIHRCLARSPDDRYASARDLRADLAHGSTRPLWRRRDVQAMPSVAVLPFVSLAGDGSHDYLADGLTSELTSQLAQGGGLLVIARTSTMRYRQSVADARTIGGELGVRALVEGTCRVRNGRCALKVNLIDVENGFHLWAGSFDTTVDDAFDVSSEVARRIRGALRVPAQEESRPTATRHGDRRTVELYLRAVHAYHKFTGADNAIAIELLQGVIQREPRYAKAHALLANASLARIERGWEGDIGRWLGLAQQASAEALRLDAGISEAYSARGLIAFFAKANDAAEGDVREALQADSNNDIAHNLLGRLRFARGEFRGAIAAYRDALAINPYYVWCLNDLAWAYLLTGQEGAAQQTLERVLSLSPTDEGGHCGRAAFHLMRGAASDALVEIRKAQESNPTYPWVLELLPPVLASAGQVAEAELYCEGLIAREESAFFGHASLGLVQARAGDGARLRASVARAMERTPFYAATNLSYASLYAAAGEQEVAREWVRKAVREGIRLVEVDAWHPTLRKLAMDGGLIPSRSDDD